MKQKFYSSYGEAIDKNGERHVVTVVGEFKRFKEKRVKDTTITLEDGKEAVVLEQISRKKRTFKMAYAICHPEDEFNQEIGEKIAKRRLKQGEIIGTVSTFDVTMLNDDQCELMVFGETCHIINQIDHYLEKHKNRK